MRPMPKIVAISAGHSHSLLLDDRGRVYACGDGQYGKLGVFDTHSRLHPTRVRGIPRCKAVSAGVDHSLVLSRKGAVFAFGRGASGQLGVNDGQDYPFPVCVCEDPPVVGISAGGSHSLLLDNTGTVWSFGNNFNGRLGLGHVQNRHFPEQIAGTCWSDALGILHEARAVPRFAAVCAGFDHSVLLDCTGRVFTFGAQESGKLGMGDAAQRFLPAQVMGLPKAFSVSAGHHHSLVLVRGVDAEVYHRQFMEAANRLASEEDARFRRWEDENKRRVAAMEAYQQKQAEHYQRFQQMQAQQQQQQQQQQQPGLPRAPGQPPPPSPAFAQYPTQFPPAPAQRMYPQAPPPPAQYERNMYQRGPPVQGTPVQLPQAQYQQQYARQQYPVQFGQQAAPRPYVQGAVYPRPAPGVPQQAQYPNLVRPMAPPQAPPQARAPLMQPHQQPVPPPATPMLGTPLAAGVSLAGFAQGAVMPPKPPDPGAPQVSPLARWGRPGEQNAAYPPEAALNAGEAAPQKPNPLGR